MSDSSVPFLETIEKKIIEEGREIEEVTGISSPKKTKSALPSTAREAAKPVRVQPVKVSEKESSERPSTETKVIVPPISFGKVAIAPSPKEEVVPPVFLSEKNVVSTSLVRGDETDRASGKGRTRPEGLEPKARGPAELGEWASERSRTSSKSSNSHLSRRSVLQKVWADPSRRVAYPGSWSLSSYSEWFRSI